MTTQAANNESIPDILDVILPAGGRITGDFARAAGVEVKALIRFQGKTMLRQVIEVLRATGRVRRLAVIGPDEVHAEACAIGVDGTLEEGDSGPDNIFRGLSWLQSQPGGATPRVLIVTTDLPLLTVESITGFLDAAPQSADIAIPVVSQAAFETLYPGIPSTYTRLREGGVTLGCIFLVHPEVLLRSRPHLETLFSARKSTFQQLQLLGLPFILRYLTRTLALAHIEARCRQVLGCTGAAVPNAAPELAFDIDLPEEYAYACAHLKDPTS